METPRPAAIAQEHELRQRIVDRLDRLPPLCRMVGAIRCMDAGREMTAGRAPKPAHWGDITSISRSCSEATPFTRIRHSTQPGSTPIPIPIPTPMGTENEQIANHCLEATLDNAPDLRRAIDRGPADSLAGRTQSAQEVRAKYGLSE